MRALWFRRCVPRFVYFALILAFVRSVLLRVYGVSVPLYVYIGIHRADSVSISHTPACSEHRGLT